MKFESTSSLFAAAGNPAGGGRDSSRRPIVPRIPSMQFPGEKGGRHYTPWLVVRFAPGDFGSRPLPGGSVFWESPDVWVVSSLGVNQPVPGEPNTLFARVSNFGLQDATGVSVRFWWANPSIAISEATAHLIGTGSTNIIAGSTEIVECPTKWIPVVENNGHECLLAEAFIPGFDPLLAPMDPVDDRHVGQKNEQLVMAAQGNKFKVELLAVNIAPFAQALTIDVHALALTEIPNLVAARTALATNTALAANKTAIKPSKSALPLSFDLAESAAFFSGPSTAFARRLLARAEQEVAGRGSDCFAPVQITREARFEAGEARNVVIQGQVPPNAQPGQLFAFRTVQRTGHMVMGGYTVFVLVT